MADEDTVVVVEIKRGEISGFRTGAGAASLRIDAASRAVVAEVFAAGPAPEEGRTLRDLEAMSLFGVAGLVSRVVLTEALAACPVPEEDRTLRDLEAL